MREGARERVREREIDIYKRREGNRIRHHVKGISMREREREKARDHPRITEWKGRRDRGKMRERED